MQRALILAAGVGCASLCGWSAGQVVRVVPSTLEPAHNEVVSIDIVLDATDYGGPFAAWNQYGFTIQMVASGAPVDDSNLLPIDERMSETAGSDVDGNGFLDVFATGSPWLSGRRPGAFIGAPSSAGGSRFGNFGADTIVNIPGGLEIGSTLSTGEFFSIGGLQEPVSPLNNAFIHRGRVYEAFRFAFVYDAANGAIDVLLNRVVTNVYTSPTSGLNEFIASDIENATIVPAPGVVLAGVGFAAFGLRRRPPHRAT